MILLTLAAFAQAPSAAVATRDTAMTCAAATAVAAGEATVRVTSQASYFVMQATRADPQGKPFTDRYQELMAQLVTYARPLVPGGAMEGRAPGIVQECDRTYPLARATRLPRLPQDAFERDLMCLGVVSFVEGMGRDSAPGGAPPHDEMLAAQQAFVARLPDSRTQAAGLPDTAAVTRRVGELLGQSMDLGNTEAVGRSCLAVLGG
jgi:hypothetical protein